MEEELAALRAELKAEEEAKEVLSLRAELAKAQQERAALLATSAPESSSATKKKPRSKEKKKQPWAQGEDSEEKKRGTTEEDATSNKKQRFVPGVLASLPVATPPDARPTDGGTRASWEDLAKWTASCERYRAAFGRIDRDKDSSWASSKACGDWCRGRAHALAIDCEMCKSRDPVTQVVSSSELVRVSIIDADTSEVVLDSLVAPSLPVVDYVTRVHGIDEAALQSVAFTRRHAQAALIALVCDHTILIGHGIINDLVALRFDHSNCVDTSALFVCPNDDTPGLRDVAVAVLADADCRAYLARSHDSVVDARTALLCAKSLEAIPSASLPVVVDRAANVVAGSNHKAENSKPVDADAKLFAHRIPADFDADALARAVEAVSGLKVLASNFVKGDPYSKCTITLKSKLHADLAFETLGSAFEEDKQGRPQKKIFLKAAKACPARAENHPAGPYCKIRQL